MDKMAGYLLLISILLLPSYSLAELSHTSDLSKALCHPARKEILEKLRSEIKSWTDRDDIVFVVQFLRSGGGWAYAHVLPRSKDAKSRYEDVSALLHYERKAWKIMEIRPCCGDCADDPDCADDRRYFMKLRSRFPAAPMDIFPSVE